MKRLLTFTIVQCVIVVALLLLRPSHRFENHPASHENGQVRLDSSSPRESAFLSDNAPSGSSRPGQLTESDQGLKLASQVESPRGAKSTVLDSGRLRKTGQPNIISADTSGNEPAGRMEELNLLQPTPEQVEQALSIPLAFVAPPAEAGFTTDQTADLAQIAGEFANAVGGTDQNPADPAYAETFHDARNLADELVWTISGQEAYMALVNQRAQNAGNAPGQ